MSKCQTQCDNCLNPDVERSDISEQAKMFLSAVYRTDQRFGQGHIVDVLLGSKNQKVLNSGHQNLSVHGIGNSTSRTLWNIIGDRLLEIDALMVGKFKVLKLTDIAKQALRREIAKEEGLPAYIIFDNKTLTEMAHFLPNNEEKQLQINGVGQVKL